MMRLDKRLTQEQVAAKMKVSQSSYSAIERGKRPSELPGAKLAVNDMRTRNNRTAGGGLKAGREKS